MEKLYFRTNGFIVEFLKIDKIFFIYFFKRITSFLIDMSFCVVLQILFYLFFKNNFLYMSLIPFAIFFFYNIICLSIFKNKTLGMFISSLVIIDHDGGNNKNYTFRIMIYSIYAFPIIGWGLSTISLVTILLTKGISFVDLISKTQVSSKYFFTKVKDINKHIV